TPFLFNGRYGVQTDPNGLLYMRARYYNPYICRFINPDPIGFSGGLNWYAYADGNPVTYVDPVGLWVEAVWDAANIGMGAYSLQSNVRAGNWGWAALDAVGLVYDVAATAVPFLPAGASAAFKAARAGNTVADSISAGLDVARVAEHTHQAARTMDVVSRAPLPAAQDGLYIHRQVATEVGDSLWYFDATSMAGANRASGVRPDMIGEGRWADITTPKQWAHHREHYQAFGIGIPILYERGTGVIGTTRLLPAGGLGMSILQGVSSGTGPLSWLASGGCYGMSGIK
ncbi:MAG: RHS repeat-associated core domain-containing protein, partial [Verrucomicrobiota bacterium]|nr:RHS repeat-associated core domain-containing protein [Verrucomicrobiota bacterium]